ncbi:hypothetical protein GNZ20_10525 [Burkholderia pseudomallei]|nr:hypothetical protein [Burkholderia pseudomallei]
MTPIASKDARQRAFSDAGRHARRMRHGRHGHGRSRHRRTRGNARTPAAMGRRNLRISGSRLRFARSDKPQPAKPVFDNLPNRRTAEPPNRRTAEPPNR